MYSLGGYSLANGAVTIDPTSNPSNNGGGQPIIGILLVNAQPVPVNIQMDSTTSTMLAGNGATVLPVSGAQGLAPSKITVTPTAVTTGDVLVTVFQQGDSLPLSTPSNTTIQNAPMARLTYTASNVTIRAGSPVAGTTTIGPIGLLPTERSIVIIFTQPAAGSASLTFGVFVEGLVSQAAYFDGSVTNQHLSFYGTEYGWPPLVAPAYGTVDEQIQLIVSYSSSGGNIVMPDIYVLAVPDEVLQGTPTNPTQVTGTVDIGNTGLGSSQTDILYVGLSDGSSTALLGTNSNPVVIRSSGSEEQVTTTVGTSAVQVLAPPSAGSIRTVDAVSCTTGSITTVDVGVISGLVAGQGLRIMNGATYGQVTPLGWTIQPTDPGLYAIAGAAGVEVTVFYHDQYI